MAEFILHKGDKVMSHQYGEGVVTAVDEGLCTVRFAAKEVSFRVPDAFEKGRLIWIGSAKLSKKAAKASKAGKPKKHWLGLIIFYLFFIAFGLVVVAYPISLLLGNGDKSAILLWLFCVAFFVAMVYSLFKSKKKKKGPEPQAPEVEEIESDEADRSDDSGVAAGFLTGMMGGYFLGRSSRHHKSVFDSARDELFWQEKNRHHDDDFTDGESW